MRKRTRVAESPDARRPQARTITAGAGQAATDGEPVGASEPTLTLSGVAWLAADMLVAVVSGVDSDEDVSLIVAAGDDAIESESVWLGYGDGDTRDGVGAILVACLREARRDRNLEVTVSSAGRHASVGPAPASTLGLDLRTLIRENLAAHDAETRARIIDFVVIETGRLASMDQPRLSHSLFILRGGLRDLGPRSVVVREQPQGLNVEAIVGLDQRSFFVRGWMRDEQAKIVGLTAVSPEGARASLIDGLFKTRRPDVDQLYGTPAERNERPGFLAHFELDAPSWLERGWIFEMENATGVSIEAEGPEVIRDPVVGRGTIVSELAHERGPDTPLMDHVVPAVTRLQERLAESVSIERVEQFGPRPTDPEVSIVVPLYQRIDLLDHQLASFADDLDLERAELIYVLDSPELSDGLFTTAADLHEIYRVPFRIAEASRNGGFSVANNLGASLASGRLLLLLNSDVLPASPGWLSRLATFFDSNRKIGALGPKLLFDDDTLQHAGLYWRRATPHAPWENAHYFKGIHGSLEAANVARPMPAVTAACLLTSTDLYRELGGLRNIYIQGDYEDSDLCLRLREAGYETWYVPEVELYHLEGRSYDTSVRQTHARYNSWLHTRLWGDEIEQLMGGDRFTAGK